MSIVTCGDDLVTSTFDVDWCFNPVQFFAVIMRFESSATSGQSLKMCGETNQFDPDLSLFQCFVNCRFHWPATGRAKGGWEMTLLSRSGHAHALMSASTLAQSSSPFSPVNLTDGTLRWLGVGSPLRVSPKATVSLMRRDIEMGRVAAPPEPV